MFHLLHRLFARRNIAAAVALAIGVTLIGPLAQAARGDDWSSDASSQSAGTELTWLRTETSKTFSTPDPEVRKLRLYSEPIHFKDDSGRWKQIDTDLERSPSGRFEPDAAAADADFAAVSSDEDIATLTIDGKTSASFGLADAATVPAKVDDASATYEGVLPGADLELTALNHGIKETIVLDSAAAPHDYEFPLSLEGLTAAIDSASGDVVYTDAAGTERLRTPHGFMQDSSGSEHTDEGVMSQGVTYTLSGQADSLSLHVHLDEAWLSDPARVYPVIVDPSWNQTTTDDTFVQSAYPNNNYSTLAELKAGTYNGGADKAMSLLNFQNAKTALTGKTPTKAVLQLYNTHSWSCQERPVDIKRIVGPAWNGATAVSYATAPTLGETVDTQSFSYGYSGCNPEGAFVTFDVLTAAQRWASGDWAPNGLAITTNEGDNYSWKKFSSSDNPAGFHPNITVDYVTTSTNTLPSGVYESVTGAAGRVTVQGWAKDPDVPNTTPIQVDAWEGTGTKYLGYLVANLSRGDVGPHGFGGPIEDLAAGSHNICLYAINTPSDPTANKLLGCKTATVTAATAPGQTRSVTVANEPEGDISLSWTPPVSDGGARIDSYMIAAYKTGVGLQKTGTVDCKTTRDCTTYTFSGLDIPGQYSFAVYAHNKVGYGAASAGAGPIWVTSYPAQPQTPVATANPDGTIGVTWGIPAKNGGATIDKYVVAYYDANGTVGSKDVLVNGSNATTFSTTFSVPPLTLQHSYSFRVNAHNTIGYSAPSAYSNLVQSNVSPSKPLGVTASPRSNGDMKVSWNAPAPNGGTPPVEYQAKAFQDGADTGLSAACNIPCATVDVAGLTPGIAYTFRAQARNAAGWGALSDEVLGTSQGKPSMPGKPVAVTTDQGGVDLYASTIVTWTPPTFNGGSPINKYFVTATDLTAEPQKATTVECFGTCATTTRTLTFEDLDPGHRHAFTVIAENEFGLKSDPSQASEPIIVLPAETTAPSDVRVARGDQKVTVSWTRPTVAVPNKTKYTVHVYRGTTNESLGTVSAEFGNNNCPGATAPCLVVSELGNGYRLKNGTAVSFTVTSTNLSITSIESARSAQVTPAGPPFKPRNVSAVASDRSATVSFDAPGDQSDGTPGDNGDAITSYIVTAYNADSDAKVDELTVGGSPARFEGSDHSLVNGTRYYFKVRAKNGVGTGDESDASDPVTPSGKPSPPTNVVATQSGTLISLSWSAPDPNGSSLTSYTISATPTNAGDTVDVVEGESDPAFTSGVPIPDLVTGVEYEFRVAAVNGNGGGPSSEASNRLTQAGAPEAPNDVAATASGTAANVSWSSPVIHGIPVTGYVVSAYSTISSQVVSETVDDPQATSHNLGGLDSGPYIFTVAAISDLGTGLAGSTGGDLAPKYVALGDSFSSGEGAPPFNRSSNKCHRSSKSYAAKFAAAHPQYEFTFAACSGAKIADVLQNEQHPGDTFGGQISQLPTDANLVTLSIGGNDAGFGSIITHCVLTIDCHKDYPNKAEEVRGLQDDLEAVYSTIHQVAPRAKIQVFNYPKFLTNDVPRCLSEAGLGSDEITWIRSMIGEMNNTILLAANAVPGVTVIDVEDAWAGPPHHEVCGSEPWHNGIRNLFRNRTSSFHPNEAGYQYEAGRLSEVGATRAPAITSVSPSSGVDSRTPCRTSVSIAGSDFGAHPTVLFGDAPSTNVTVESSSKLIAEAPAQLLGRVPVTVRQNEGLFVGSSAPSDAATFTYRRDEAGPSTSASSSPAPNAQGWFSTNPTITLAASDPTCPQDVATITYSTSGAQTSEATVDGNSASFTIAAEGVTTITYAATDFVGNREPAKQLIVRLDKTAPVGVQVSADRPADRNGWYNHTFTATWSGADVGSGVAFCTVTTYSSGDTANGALTGTCTDNAGNISVGAVFDFNYDATGPEHVIAEAREPDNDGWYNHPIHIPFTAFDATSGLEGCSTSDFSGPDGAAHTVSGSCTDVAGNTAVGQFGPFKYDVTPGQADIDGPPTRAIEAGSLLTGTATDNLSGVSQVLVTFSLLSGQAETRLATCERGCGTTAAEWSVSTTGLGGAYTVTAATIDAAGNVSPNSDPVAVVVT